MVAVLRVRFKKRNSYLIRGKLNQRQDSPWIELTGQLTLSRACGQDFFFLFLFSFKLLGLGLGVRVRVRVRVRVKAYFP